MLITFTAYILIPVYTLLFVAGSDWFTTNFSVLGNIAGRNEAFVLWGLMVGIYFFVCLRKIFRCMPEKPAGTWLVPLALVLLDFAVTTPYLPEMFPLKAYLHIVFAFLAAACLILCVFLTVLKLYQRDPGNTSHISGGSESSWPSLPFFLSWQGSSAAPWRSSLRSP